MSEESTYTLHLTIEEIEIVNKYLHLGSKTLKSDELEYHKELLIGLNIQQKIAEAIGYNINK